MQAAHHLHQVQESRRKVCFLVDLPALALPRSWQGFSLMIDAFAFVSINLFFHFISLCGDIHASCSFLAFQRLSPRVLSPFLCLAVPGSYRFNLSLLPKL
jgi:hypothetical protein